MRNLSPLILILISLNLNGQADSLKTKLEKKDAKLALWSTYYYVPTLNHDEKGIDLLDKNEKATGLKLDSCDWCKASIEGTVIIKKHQETYVLNYAGRSKKLQYNCKLCKSYKDYENYKNTGKVLWTKSSGLGKGIMNYNLVPYITIAVDSSEIPYGTVIYIPRAKGIQYINQKGEAVS